jgi:adenine-specific DNA-methyltransferase
MTGELRALREELLRRAPGIVNAACLEVLRSESKWTRFPLQDSRSGAAVTTLGDLFDIKRGIATGSNEYFMLTAERIAELELPRKFCRPILPSPRYLDGDEIAADKAGNPILVKPLFLLDCRLPEEEVKARYPRLWAYYEHGRDEMSKRYLCKTRSPWYAQENRLPSPFLCTYMGRGSKGSHQPFRFILNHSSAIVANSYLVLYPKAHLTEQLRRDRSLARKLWQALNSISAHVLTEEGRVYGGGLHKMEPKELANVPAERVIKLVKQPTQPDLFASHT